MINITPHNKSVICINVIKDYEDVNINGFVFSNKRLPEYKIISVSNDIHNFNIGDIIITNSTGTKLEDNDVCYYLFKEENIVGKVL